MENKQFFRLTGDQIDHISKFLQGKPVSLAKGFSDPAIVREFDVFVYEAAADSPVKTYEGKAITSGRFFRIVRFSHTILGAMCFGHDKYGVFGPPRTVSVVPLTEFIISKQEYEEFLSDLSGIVHSIDSSVQIEWSGMDFTQFGPIIRQTESDLSPIEYQIHLNPAKALIYLGSDCFLSNKRPPDILSARVRYNI